MFAHDASAGAKHELARLVIERLWRDRSGEASTQVLQELRLNLRSNARRPLYSEDLSDGQVYGSVRVVNPLAADGHAAS